MGKLIETKLPCPMCDSSDAYSIYLEENGNKIGTCFSCTKSKLEEGTATMTDKKEKEYGPPAIGTKRGAVADRGLSLETCRKMDITQTPTEKGTTYYFGHYTAGDDGTPKKVMTKVRHPDKVFASTGDTSKPTLFGMAAFTPSNKVSVTITEGEFDAAAYVQMTGYPAVSIRSSASALKDIEANYEYLNGFKEVVLCFDRDPAGNKAVEEVKHKFAGKLKIMRMKKHKDASDYLTNGDTAAFKDEWFNAKAVKVDGIITGIEAIMKKAMVKPQRGLPLIWEGINDITRGVRLQEVWTFGGGTGLGKSELFKEISYGLMMDCMSVGLVMLEESSERTIQCLLGKVLNKRYYLEDVDFPSEEELQRAGTTIAPYLNVADKCRSDWDKVKEKVEFMVNGLGIKYIFIDHLTAIAEGKASDVNGTLHMVLESLNHMAVSLNCTFFCISHLNQAGNKNYTEGAHVSLRDFYGSGAIMQRSNFVFGFEGDFNGDKVPKNTRLLRCLKDRNAGDGGGKLLTLKYDHDTGRLNEHEPEGTEEI